MDDATIRCAWHPLRLAGRRCRFALTLLLVLALLVPAYGAEADEKARRTVTDPTGRSVEVPLAPRRIVALAPSVTEVIFALGQERRLVGVTRFSNHPPEAATLPKVGSYVQLDVERIAALGPDLCIAIKDGNPIAAVERLTAMGIPVFAVDPVDLTTVMHTVTAIGDLLNAEGAAANIVADMERRIEAVRLRLEGIQERPRVFLQIGVSPIVSVGRGTFIDTLIRMAGGTNVAGGGMAYPRFSREQVLLLAPEVIVISSMERTAVFEQVKAEWLQWPSLPAVQRNAVHIAPPDLFDRPSPRLVDALEVLAAFIHPDRFEARR